MREEKIQSDELLAREKIIQANLEKALGSASSRALRQAQLKRLKDSEGEKSDASKITGSFSNPKAALKRIAKCALGCYSSVLSCCVVV